jgi:hypothetical protein
MRPSRGMGDINPSKMPKPIRKKRRDDTDFDVYARGGMVKNRKAKRNRYENDVQ